jgi:hypothetical protein
MTLRTLLAALAVAAPLPAAAQGRVRVVVMEVEPSAPELKSAAHVLTGVVLDELGRQPQVAALGSSEIAAMLGLERQRALLGCEAGSDCLAEMGNALGARYVLRGTVGALGKSLRVDLTLLDTTRAGAVAREGGTASREEDLESEARSAVFHYEGGAWVQSHNLSTSSEATYGVWELVAGDLWVGSGTTVEHRHP